MTDWTVLAAYNPPASLRESAKVADRLGQHARAEQYARLAQDAENAGALYTTFAREAALWAAQQEVGHD